MPSTAQSLLTPVPPSSRPCFYTCLDEVDLLVDLYAPRTQRPSGASSTDASGGGAIWAALPPHLCPPNFVRSGIVLILQLEATKTYSAGGRPSWPRAPFDSGPPNLVGSGHFALAFSSKRTQYTFHTQLGGRPSGPRAPLNPGPPSFVRSSHFALAFSSKPRSIFRQRSTKRKHRNNPSFPVIFPGALCLRA